MAIGIIVQSYLIPFIALLFLLVLIWINPLFEKKKTYLFMAAATVNILLILATSLDYTISLDYKEGTYFIRRITSFLNFAASPIIPILLYKIFSDKKLGLRLIPFAINFVLCFISMFTNLIFFISEYNGYDRGVLFFVPFLTTIFYIFMLIVKPVNYHLQSKKNERYFLFAIIVLLLFSMYLEIGLRFSLVNWGCTALSLVMYYLLLNIHCFIIDPLTGVYNRIMYNRALADVENKKRCVIANIDLNKFKEVNDTYGHHRGDTCLQDFAMLLNDTMYEKGLIYRIGGDEFVVISRETDYNEIQNLLKSMREESKEKIIDFSYGIVTYNPEEDLQEVLKEVDKKMYLFKKSVIENKDN